MTHFNMALRLNPKSQQALNNLGNLYSQIGEWKFAFCHYYQSYLISPSLPVSNNLAVALRRLGVKRPSSNITW